jgi:ribosomal protein L16 Arg81 hydroxylase
MFMSLGRKRWRLVSKDQIALLHPQYLCDLNPVFPEDLNVVKPNVTIYETELEAGDLIFVPAGWPHQALDGFGGAQMIPLVSKTIRRSSFG